MPDLGNAGVRVRKMIPEYLSSITDEFEQIYKDELQRIIENVKTFSEPAEFDLHSWLQYALIMAGKRAGLFPIPEVKLSFEKELKPENVLEERQLKEIKQHNIKIKKKRKFSRTDVAFYRLINGEKKLMGVGEISTINDANAYASIKDWANAFIKSKNCKKVITEFGLTKRDILIHTIKYSLERPKFVVLVATLPRKATRMPWKKYRTCLKGNEITKKPYNYYKLFKKHWVKFKKDIEKCGVNCSLLIVTESGVENVM